MSNNISSMQRLINAFTLLPGVGQKTAERYAYSIINLSKDEVDFMSNSLKEVKENVKYSKGKCKTIHYNCGKLIVSSNSCSFNRCI